MTEEQKKDFKARKNKLLYDYQVKLKAMRNEEITRN